MVLLKTAKKCRYWLFIYGKSTKMSATGDLVQCRSPLINLGFTAKGTEASDIQEFVFICGENVMSNVYFNMMNS
jgi:hypothetical protein